MKGIAVYISPENSDPTYRLINFENGELYAVEMMTLSPAKWCDVAWMPGYACCAVFALTREEFELKDSDTEALDELVAKLYQNIPEDRLMTAYYLTGDGQEKPMRPQPGCKTMDDHKWDRYEALEKGIPFLHSADKVYMIYDKTASDLLPAITWDGFANIFTKREYAENVISKSEISTLDIKEFSKKDFDEHIKTWHAFGIQYFRLNAGTQDHACSVLRDDYMPDPRAKGLEYSGSALCMYLWRHGQYDHYKNEKMDALARNMFDLFCHELEKTLFLCPVAYGEDPSMPSEPDYKLHASPEALKLMESDAYKGKSHVKFYGGERYRFADASDESARPPILLTINKVEMKFVPAFTNFATLHSVFGENVNVAVFTYDDLRSIADEDANVDGVAINLSSVKWVIWPKKTETVEAMYRREPIICISGGSSAAEPERKDNKTDESHPEQKQKTETAPSFEARSDTPDSGSEKRSLGKIKKFFFGGKSK